MRSKTSFFNRSVFKQNFLRFWPLWALYLAVELAVYPLGTVGNSVRYMAVDDVCRRVTNNLFGMLDRVGIAMNLIAGIVFAMLLLSFLTNTRQTNGFASLPIKRSELFITDYLSGIIFYTAGMVINTAVIAIDWLAIGDFSLSVVLTFLAVNVLEFIFFFSLACFCGMLTGHIAVFPLLYVVLNFLVSGLKLLISAIFSSFVYGYGESLNFIPVWLTPAIYMGNMGFYRYYPPTGESVYSANWGVFLAYGAAGIVFAVFALLIFRKRALETSTDVVAVKALRPAFKYCMTVGCALVVGIGLLGIFAHEISGGWKDVTLFMVFMVIGGFVGYFASKMMMQKSFRVFKGDWGGLCIALAVLVALTVCVEADVFGYEKKIPDISEIDSCYVAANGNSAVAIDAEQLEEALKLHSILIENKDKITKEDQYYYCRAFFTYELKNGKKMTREYNIAELDEETMAKMTAHYDNLFNSAEAINERVAMPEGYTFSEKTIYYPQIRYEEKRILPDDSEMSEWVSADLTNEQAVKLYEAVLLDAEKGLVARVDPLPKLPEPENEKANFSFELVGSFEGENDLRDYAYPYERTEKYSYFVNIIINPCSENAIACLKEFGIDILG